MTIKRRNQMYSSYGPSLVVASSTATEAVKDQAHYVCDGVADDVQINAAIAALPSTGGRVILSSGTFTCAAAGITLKSNIELVGQGDSTIVKLMNSGNGRLISYTGAAISNVRFADILFDGNGSNQTEGAARDDRSLIFLTAVSYLKFINCQVQNTRHGAALRLGGCTDVQVADCRFLVNGLGTFACDAVYTGDCSIVRLTDNYVGVCTDTGLVMEGTVYGTCTNNVIVSASVQGITVNTSPTRPSAYVNVSNNVVAGPGLTSFGIKSGIPVGGVTGPNEHLTITSNNIFNVDNGIRLQSTSRSVVSNNTIEVAAATANRFGIALEGGGSALVVKNNFVEAALVGIQWVAGHTMTTVEILGNTFQSVTTREAGTRGTGASFDSWLEGAATASASAVTLPELGNIFHITGTTTINTISLPAWQARVLLVFDGILTLTHSANLILQGAANMTTAAGDIVEFIFEGGTVWREIRRQLAVRPIFATGTGKTVDQLITQLQDLGLIRQS